MLAKTYSITPLNKSISDFVKLMFKNAILPLTLLLSMLDVLILPGATPSARFCAIGLRVNKDNLAFQKVMLNNGAYRAGEDEDHYFMRISKYVGGTK